MGGMSIWHWVVVIVLIVLLFGGNRISTVMGDVAKGIKNFRQGMKEDDTTSAPAKTSADADSAKN